MQNVMIDLMKQFNDSTVSSAKRVSELNMNTFKTITAKQSELLGFSLETGYKNAEAMSKAKDPQEAFAIQQQAYQTYNEKLVAATTESADLLIAAGNKLTAIAEEAAKVAADNNEQVVNAGKQAFTDGMAKTVELVEQSVAKGTELTEEAVAASKEAADKVVVMGKENAKQTVAATKKAAKKVAA